jgi:hypothetical protein
MLHLLLDATTPDVTVGLLSSGYTHQAELRGGRLDLGSILLMSLFGILSDGASVVLLKALLAAGSHHR